MKTNLKTLKTILENEDEIPDPIWNWVYDFETKLREIIKCDTLNSFEAGYRQLAREILGEE